MIIMNKYTSWSYAIYSAFLAKMIVMGLLHIVFLQVLNMNIKSSKL